MIRKQVQIGQCETAPNKGGKFVFPGMKNGE